MAPKSRRGKAKFRRLAQQPSAPSTTKVTTAAPPTPTTQPTTPTAPTAQYNYITNDLRLVGIVAGSMIILIIILSFVL
ncbi:MAG: hypothetical protein AB1597_02475 [Chloroflexota bacterium]